MTNLVYQLPQDIRDEFSIDENGQVWATAIATARLAGVNDSALNNKKYGLLFKLATATNQEAINLLPECLKPFAGFDYWSSIKIPDTVVSAIVHYYAYESKQASNPQARRVAMAMAGVGFRAWARRELGWGSGGSELARRKDDFKKGLGDDKFDIQSLANAVAASVSADMRQITKRLIAIESVVGAKNHYAGIAEIVNNLANKSHILPPPDLAEPFTAREYAMVVHGFDLNKSEITSLGRFASDAFAAINAGRPDQDKQNLRLYYHRDFAAWEVVFQSWLNIAVVNDKGRGKQAK